jgi:hypothetical protein
MVAARQEVSNQQNDARGKQSELEERGRQLDAAKQVCVPCACRTCEKAGQTAWGMDTTFWGLLPPDSRNASMHA